MLRSQFFPQTNQQELKEQFNEEQQQHGRSIQCEGCGPSGPCTFNLWALRIGFAFVYGR